MLLKGIEFPNGSGRQLSCNNFTDKKAKWLLLEATFFAVFIYHYLKPVFLHMTQNFSLVKINISTGSRHSNLNVAHHFVIH